MGICIGVVEISFGFTEEGYNGGNEFLLHTQSTLGGFIILHLEDWVVVFVLCILHVEVVTQTLIDKVDCALLCRYS